MFISKIAQKNILVWLAALAVVASCVEDERVVDVPPMGFPISSFAQSTNEATFDSFTRVCTGMKPFRSSDTLNELTYHSLYRQKSDCATSYTSDVCPTWILNRATKVCEGPVLLSATASGTYSEPEPRRLSDGKISVTASLFYTDVGKGETFLLESEGAFALVQR